jgi:hypothetical protein
MNAPLSAQIGSCGFPGARVASKTLSPVLDAVMFSDALRLI